MSNRVEEWWGLFGHVKFSIISSFVSWGGAEKGVGLHKRKLKKNEVTFLAHF